MTIKVGDKIRYTGPSKWDMTNGKVYEVSRSAYWGFNILDDAGGKGYIAHSHCEPVTDTPQAPTIFRDMTDAEKGALLLAKHEGKGIEIWSYDEKWIVSNYPAWCDGCAYRVKPEPVVETVTLYTSMPNGIWGWTADESEGKRTHRITFALIDGNPDPASIKMEVTE